MVISLYENLLCSQKKLHVTFFCCTAVFFIFLLNGAYADDNDPWVNIHIQNNLDYPIAIGFNTTGDETSNTVSPNGGYVPKDHIDLLYQQPGISSLYVEGHWNLTVFKHTTNNVGSDEIGAYTITYGCEINELDNTRCIYSNLSAVTPISPPYKETSASIAVSPDFTVTVSINPVD